MDINNIPIKQNANQVTDPNTQVSAEEFNAIVNNAKEVNETVNLHQASITDMNERLQAIETETTSADSVSFAPEDSGLESVNVQSAIIEANERAKSAEATMQESIAEIQEVSGNREATAARMGYVILDPSKTFAEQVTEENTIYEIRDEFDLGGSSTPFAIKEGCVLKFEGGSLKNGTIKGQGSSIQSNHRCFYGVYVIGDWNCISRLEWWCEPSILNLSTSGGSFTMTNIDCTNDFQYALDADFSELHINGHYYITDTLVLKKYKRLVLSGLPINYSFASKGADSMLSSVVYSDKDITLLRIAVEAKSKYGNNRVSIEGGNFDVSRVSGYSSNCIEVDIRENRKIWGLNIDTGINGCQTAYAPATGCGIKFLTDSRSGYATMVRIKGNIMWFGIGIHIHDNLPCWITDVEVNGVITNCAKAIDAKTDIYINASIQPYTAYTNETKRDVPLINIAGGRAVIGGMIWDLGSSYTDEQGTFYANDVAINIEDAEKVAVVGKIKQLGYDYKSPHVTGNVSLLREHDYTMGDKYNIEPNIAYNCFEAFAKKGGACSVTLHSSDGTQIEEGMTVSNIEKVFNSTSSAAKISLDSYDREDGRYIEINLSNINLPVIYFGFVTMTANYGFGRYSIEYINDGSVVHRYENKTTPLDYGKTTIFDTSSTRFSAITGIRVRLYELFEHISILSVIGNVLVSEYQGYRPSFLPIGGGTVYGGLEVEGNVESEVLSARESIKLGNSEIAPIGKNVATGKEQGLFKIEFADTERMSAEHIIMLRAYTSSDLNMSIYAVCVWGSGSNSELRMKKIWGNVDYKFKHYTLDARHHAVTIDLTSHPDTYSMVYMEKINAAKKGFSLATMTEIQDGGYTESGLVIWEDHGTKWFRPVLNGIGNMYFDTSLGKPIWWNGSAWVEGDNQAAGIKRAGTWSQRPNADGTVLENGFQYFLLESTSDADPDGQPIETTTGEGKAIWWIQDSQKWVDATGATVTG